MRLALLALASAGCLTPYRPGVLAHETHAEIRELGCIDLGMLIGARAEATGTVIVVYLGNRCDHSVAIDLAALRVVGGDSRGATVAMVAYDPDHEIEPRRIDGRVRGEEWIEYQAVEPLPRPSWLDVDIGGVVPGERPTDRWIRLVLPRSS